MLRIIRPWLIALLLTAAPLLAHAAAHSLTADDLKQAHELGKDRKYAAAATLYSRWLKEHPEDADVLMAFGYNFYLQATAESDRVLAAGLMKKAHKQLERAKTLGCDDPLLDKLLENFDASGRPLTPEFSRNEEAQALLQRAEQSFAKGRFDDALVLYQQALEQDPKNFAATLFIGDIHFNRREYADAIVWFDKAVALQPDTETSYRYCGDAYLKMGRPDDALAKYIDAVIAAPYDRTPFEMLKRWSAQTHAPITRSPIAFPVVQVKIKDGKTEIGYDPESGPIILLYALARAKWLTEDRASFFPEDATPRHSLPEEKSALEMVIAVADESAADMQDELKRWEKDIALLRRVKEAGLLDAFILLDRANQDISQDYAAYRETNRAQLVRYIREFWLGQKAAATH